MTLDEIFAILNKKIESMTSPDNPDNNTPTYEGENYSYEERQVGTWVNDKPLYERVIDFGSLPNKTAKSVTHGIVNSEIIWLYGGFVQDGDDFYELNHPRIADNVPAEIKTYDWKTKITRTAVIIETSADKSTAAAVAIIRYTKTTD